LSFQTVAFLIKATDTHMQLAAMFIARAKEMSAASVGFLFTALVH
jgi:hypothetical protein